MPGNTPAEKVAAALIDIVRGASLEERMEHFAGCMRDGLQMIGMYCNSDNPSIRDTPERFVKYLMEFCKPVDLDRLLGEGFEAYHDRTSIHGMIVQTDIPFRMVCEHHLMPAWGKAHVGYIPQDRIVGLSKIARLVDAYCTERPSLQEAIGEKIADAMFRHLKSKGSIVVISAIHGCMACRGVTTPGVVTNTSCIRGVFRDVEAARQEFFYVVNNALRN